MEVCELPQHALVWQRELGRGQCLLMSQGMVARMAARYMQVLQRHARWGMADGSSTCVNIWAMMHLLML